MTRIARASASRGLRLRRLLARVLGAPVSLVALCALRLTSRRAGVALMYHSVAERAGDPDRELVPPHRVDIFEQQIAHVRRHYRVVPAAELQAAARSRRRGERFPVAITFDDDLACHAAPALPILVRQGVTATFFLSGASLERPFAFWYERLQRAHDEGVPALPRLVLGEDAATREPDLHALALAVEELEPAARDAVAARLGEALGPDPDDAGIRTAQVAELAARGMTIGFHTRRHDALSLLRDDAALAAALVDGRAELEAIAGGPLHVVGYPHGRADERVGRAAAAAGFTAGFTTRAVAVTPVSDPLLQGRVGPSLRSAGALAVQLVLTLRRG